MQYIPTTTNSLKVGDVFNRYTVLGIYKRPDKYPKYALVKCSCGSPEKYITAATVKNGGAKSCGCLQKEQVTKHGMWQEPLFKVWKGMMSRCYNPKDKRYNRYGGRGIKVCKQWYDISAFIRDMQPSFQKGLTIDRIDNNGDYEISNCKWATRKEQNCNYSRNVVLEFNGEKLCLSEWAEKLGINYSTIYYRFSAGWPVSKILTTQII